MKFHTYVSLIGSLVRLILIINIHQSHLAGNTSIGLNCSVDISKYMQKLSNLTCGKDVCTVLLFQFETDCSDMKYQEKLLYLSIRLFLRHFTCLLTESGELLTIGGKANGCPFHSNKDALPDRANVSLKIAKRMSCMAHLNPPGSTCFVAGKSLTKMFSFMNIVFVFSTFYRCRKKSRKSGRHSHQIKLHILLVNMVHNSWEIEKTF